MGQWQIRFDKMQIQKYVLNLLKQHAQGLLECIFCISVGFIVFDMTFLPFFFLPNTELMARILSNGVTTKTLQVFNISSSSILCKCSHENK